MLYPCPSSQNKILPVRKAKLNDPLKLNCALQTSTKPDNEPVHAIQGNILLNKTMVKYLCDPGAALTVISRKLFETLNKAENPIPLRPYIGEPIMSCNKRIKVLGVIRINRCTLSTEFSVRHFKVIVMEDLARYDCIMGRDLIAKIPCFTNPIEELRIQVNKYSENLLSCADQILSRSEDEPEIIQSKVEEGDIIIFPGFQDNRPTLVEYQGKAQVKEIETEIKSMSEENRVRSTIQAKLEECAAGKVTDIDLRISRLL